MRQTNRPGSRGGPWDRVYRGDPWTGTIRWSMDRVPAAWGQVVHAMFCKHPGHDGPEQVLKFTVKTAIRVFSLV